MSKNSNLKTGLIVAGFVVAAGILYSATHSPSDAKSHDSSKEDTVKPKDRVKLTEAKIARSGIQIAAVERRTLQPIRTVPGTIEYNGTRHVAVKAPTDGLVKKMAVLVGDHVSAGQLLSIINSPELGERRSDVLQQEADLKLSRQHREWWSSVETNLKELVDKLKSSRATIAEVEQEFAKKLLGDYRREVFSAYSKFRTAESVVASLAPLAEGDIAKRERLERQSLLDSAKATFYAACEQAIFDVRQKVGKAVADEEDAMRRLAVARQRLNWLTGSSPELPPDQANEESLSTWPVVAPFDASVEEVTLATAERVRQGEEILLLADTTRLWVQANIRDRDWAALSLTKGQQIQVQSAAIPNRTLSATIVFVGRTVSQETRAAPLVADISNEEQLLRPGMFVRVMLPDGEPIERLAIPDAAVARHEGRTFVFIDGGDGEYLVRDVVIGREINGLVEVNSGLSEGDRIAISGVFQLKSELLLEPEE